MFYIKLYKVNQELFSDLNWFFSDLMRVSPSKVYQPESPKRKTPFNLFPWLWDLIS